MRAIVFWIIIVSCCPSICAATGTPDYLTLRDIPVDYFILATDDESVGIEEILRPEWQDKFQPPHAFGATSPEMYYWLKIDFKDHDLRKVARWSLFIGFYDEMILYYRDNDTYGSRKTGTLIPNTSDSLGTMEEIPFIAEELFQERFLYLRLRHVQEFRALPEESLFYSDINASKFYNNFFPLDSFNKTIPTFLFIGGITVMMFFSFSVFFLYRDKILLYYSLYLLTLVLYLGRKTTGISYLGDYPQADYIFNEVIQVVVNICYVHFALAFLNARKNYPLVDKAGKYIMWLLLIVILFEVGLLSSNIFSPYQIYLISFERLFMTCFAIAGVLYIMFTLKNKESLFIIVGSVCFTGGALASLLYVDVRWMMAGTIAEIFIFAMGLGYRFQKMQVEKRRIEREMEKVKLTALQAQMNPHFIFNSLNSIRAYILVSETKKASDYLIKFSKLIRMILEYASLEKITLEKEIAALKLYVELEQMRFRECFDFSIKIESSINPRVVLIPPLILQPYLENAIGHGLAPKSGKKTLTLCIDLKNKDMVFTITDNGVGRKQARRNKPKYPEKKSMALALTKERINLMNPGIKGTNLSINDLYDDGKPSGTEVKLILPLMTIPYEIKNSNH